jgi:hypothetical protein
MGEKSIKIPFDNWCDEDYIAGYVRNVLKGVWRNSSGCWSENYVRVWYRETENKTFAHFPSDPCYTWEGNVVREVSRKIRSFINRLAQCRING